MMMDKLPDVFKEEVLKTWLDPTDLALLARVGRDYRAAVMSCGVVIAGDTKEAPFEVSKFVESVELLAWAKANKIRWNAAVCERAAEGTWRC